MSIVKVIEVIATSPKGWEDAARQAVKEASTSVKNIKHFYVEHQQAIVVDNEITEFRVNGKISFIID